MTELDHENWAEFLDAASKELFNSPASIEIFPVGAPPRTQVSVLALQTLAYDHRGDVFEVGVACGGPRQPSTLRHLVDHPVRIEIDSCRLLAPTAISVEDRDGLRTVIRIGRLPDASA